MEDFTTFALSKKEMARYLSWLERPEKYREGPRPRKRKFIKMAR